MQGLLKNVSGLPLCFKSLKTQACLQQHLPSTSAGCGQLFMLRLNMGVHFDLLGNKLWEVHLWLRVNTPFKASTLQSTDSNSHVIQRGKLSKCHPESLVKLGNDQCDIHKQWILLSSHMHTLTPQGDAPNVPWQGSEEPEKTSNTQLKSSPSWILPSEVLCPWAWGGVWKPVFRRSFPSGFNDQPSLGMVGLIFIVFSFFPWSRLSSETEQMDNAWR